MSPSEQRADFKETIIAKEILTKNSRNVYEFCILNIKVACDLFKEFENLI